MYYIKAKTLRLTDRSRILRNHVRSGQLGMKISTQRSYIGTLLRKDLKKFSWVRDLDPLKIVL